MSSDIIYDTIIVGGGPAGSAAALHLTYHKRSILVLDRLTSPMYFHTNTIKNYPSVNTYQEGRTLIHQLQGVAKAAGAPFKASNVVDIQGSYPEFLIKTNNSFRTQDVSNYRSKTIILATGTARKHPKVDGKWRKWLPVANIGDAAFYCTNCEAPLCSDKDVLVVNSGTVNSALYVANSLSRFTKNISILMTEDAYIPIEEQDLTKLDNSPFSWRMGVIKSIEFPNPGRVQSVSLTDGTRIKTNVFFVSLIAEARSGLAKLIGVELDEKGNIITDKRGKTNIEGVWAAGDVRPITQQVAVAAGTGNYAALMVNHSLGKNTQ
jgi:thioredoxin reductase